MPTITTQSPLPKASSRSASEALGEEYTNMRPFSILLPLLAAFVTFATSRSIAGDRVLVVLEDQSEKPLYSQFWSDLESRNFKLTFESPKADKLDLFKHGELAYDHLILTPPKSKGYGPALTPKILLEYTNAGGNVLLGLSSETSTPTAIASLLLELDISLPADRSSVVVDHFNYDTTSASENHNILVLPRPQALRTGAVNFFGGDGLLAVPNSVGQSLGNTNHLINPILRAPKTAYVYNPKDDGTGTDEVFATGSQIAIISAMQARNSARFTVLGSLEMLQDKWFTANVKGLAGNNVKTVNRAFAKQLTEWTFKEVGVLKAGKVEHHEIDPSPAKQSEDVQVGFENPTIYRIKNHVAFSMEMSAWSRDHYEPYTPPVGDDLQLEFSMLSPFYRIPLTQRSATSNATLYGATFKLPDQHGIFAFKVNYKRSFLTNIEEKRQVTVRHFAHDEWPRSWAISGAWPWIAGLWSVIGGFLAFVMVWLYCEPPKQTEQRRRALSK